MPITLTFWQEMSGRSSAVNDPHYDWDKELNGNPIEIPVKQ
jgi:hypothetical protein